MSFRVLAGSIFVSVGLWLLDLTRLSGYAFAGVTDPEARNRVLAVAQPALASLELKLCLLHLASGLVLGLVLGVALRGRLRGFLGASALTLVIFGLALFGMMGRYPQLFADRFWLGGGVFAWLQRFATHGIGPRWFDLALAVLSAALLAPSALAFVRRFLRHGRRVAIRRSAAVASVLFVALLAFRNRPSSAVDNEAPWNVLILAADSLRSDRIEDPAVMPRIAARLPEGALYRYAVTPIARTYPSWVSLLTGTEPRANGVRHMFPTIASRTDVGETFLTRLRDQGYFTFAVSDFAGDIFPGFEGGFESLDTPHLNVDTLAQSSALTSHTWSLAFLRLRLVRSLFPYWRNVPSISDPEWVADSALRQIRRSGSRPFAGVVFFSTAHFPYVAPYPEYLRGSKNYRGRYLYHVPPVQPDEAPTAEDVEQIRLRYDAALASIDVAMERILRELERRGLSGRTLVVVTGDHGEELYEEPGIAGHGDTIRYLRSQAVPIFLVGPGVTGGIRSSEQVRHYDLAATVLSLLEPQRAHRGFGHGASLLDAGVARPICVESEILVLARPSPGPRRKKARLSGDLGAPGARAQDAGDGAAGRRGAGDRELQGAGPGPRSTPVPRAAHASWSRERNRRARRSRRFRRRSRAGQTLRGALRRGRREPPASLRSGGVREKGEGRTLRPFALLALVALPVAGLAAPEDATVDCGRLADVPRPAIRFEPSTPKSALRRAHSLQQLFSEGEGRFEPGNAEDEEWSPLPWRSAPGRERNLRLVTWQDAESGNDENMPAIVLEPGASWCSPPLDLAAGARLRFEAVSQGGGNLRIDIEGAGTLFEEAVRPPESFTARRQIDLAIEEGRRTLCFRAAKAAVALGEARVLVPEIDSSDPRPRFIVLTIIDTLRDDTLDLLPALGRLAEGGQRYTNAVSPGCHTRASVWPILMGRDLMRIDALQRRQSMPIQAPLEAIYSRGNLFVGHLAESAGYHSVFLGNNAYLRAVPAFSRYSSWGRTDTGTIDTMERLPDLLARYADERILLVYYVSTPHAHSETPRRLYDELRCSELRGFDECRCRYQARARHADEAVEALESGLRTHGLEGRVLQVLTADHAEVFGDGAPLEGEIQSFATGERGGAFASFDRGHGYACHEKETDVPLVVHGPGVAAGRRDAVVSGLDIVPTLLEAMRLAPPGKLDGSPLPISSASRTPPRTLVAHGFCSDARIEGGERLIWWIEGCRVREPDGTPLDHRAEIWSGGKEVATEKTDRARLESAMKRHESWLLERIPFDAFVFGVDGLEEATIRVEVENGRIVDYGPAASVYGAGRIEVLDLAGNDAALRVRFRGYRGLYHVSTLPPLARLKIEVEGHPEIVTFVGPLQLPLPVGGQPIDPGSDLPFLLADAPPSARHTPGPSLRFWWQSYQRSEHEAVRRQMSDFDRVLREWGYIR